MSTANPTIQTAYLPTRRTCKTLGYALYLSIYPHRENSPTRKYATVIMFAVWGSATLLWHLGYSPPRPEIYWAMTVVVFSIMSHLWGFEYGVLSAYRLNQQERETKLSNGGSDSEE